MCLVFLHGWSFNSNIWKLSNLADSNTEGIKVITPNLYEFQGPLTFANITSQLYEQLLPINDEIILYGWSMGGSLALELITQYPNLPIKKLVLLGATAKFTNSDGYSRGVSPIVARQLRQRIVKDVGAGLSFFQSLLWSSPAEVSVIIPANSIVSDQDKLLLTLDELYRADYREQLKLINIPTTIIHGSNDRICPLTGAQYLAENMPNTKFTNLAGVGHLEVLSVLDSL